MSKRTPTQVTGKKAPPTDSTALLDDWWYDAAYDTLRQMGQTCERSFGRKPTLEEFRQLLSVTLCVNAEDYFADGNVTEVTDVIFKTKKKPRAQPYQEGDVFAIKLDDAQYSFGRVLRFQKNIGMIIEIFRETSPTKKYKPSIVASGRLLYFLMTGGDRCIKNRRWTIVHRDDFYKISDADAALEFLFPDTHLSRRGEWVAWNLFKPRSKSRPATEEDKRRLADGAYALPETVEESIRKALSAEGERR